MIKASHSTIKRQAARRGLKTTLMDGEIFTIEEVPVKVPLNNLLFMTDRLEMPICSIDAFFRFQDMEKLKVRSYVHGVWQRAQERHNAIEKAKKDEMEPLDHQLRSDLRDLTKIKVGYNG